MRFGWTCHQRGYCYRRGPPLAIVEVPTIDISAEKWVTLSSSSSEDYEKYGLFRMYLAVDRDRQGL